jgi:molecular chaperone DnaK (HSP70)
MKMGLLSQPDLESERLTVEFEVTVPHDIGLEIDSGTKKIFFPMIRRGTSYALAKKGHAFTLSGPTLEDMTQFDLRILERIHQDDPFDACKPIGEVSIKGLPPRPNGKTKLRITLMVEEEGGLVKGSVEAWVLAKNTPEAAITKASTHRGLTRGLWVSKRTRFRVVAGFVGCCGSSPQ